MELKIAREPSYILSRRHGRYFQIFWGKNARNKAEILLSEFCLSNKIFIPPTQFLGLYFSSWRLVRKPRKERDRVYFSFGKETWVEILNESVI